MELHKERHSLASPSVSNLSMCNARIIIVRTRLQGEEWKKTTLQTALLFPGVCFGIFFCLNMLVWGQKSTGAVPWTTLFALCFLWFGISVPLVFVGSYFGYKKPALDDPVRTHKIPRQIPEQAWYASFDFDLNISQYA